MTQSELSRDTLDAFRLTLRSLEIASRRIIKTYESDDIDAAAVEAHFGLHAAYDLFELFVKRIEPVTRAKGQSSIAAEDMALARAGAELLGGLAAARGQHTHQMITFVSPGGWAGTPQGMGPFGRGWLWARHTWPTDDRALRGSWYDKRVRGRMLHNAIDEVAFWGTERYWEYVDAYGLREYTDQRRAAADHRFL